MSKRRLYLIGIFGFILSIFFTFQNCAEDFAIDDYGQNSESSTEIPPAEPDPAQPQTKTPCSVENGTGELDGATCVVKSCNHPADNPLDRDGYHIENNSCAPNTRACTNAEINELDQLGQRKFLGLTAGEKFWVGSGYTPVCFARACSTGFTLDNELDICSGPLASVHRYRHENGFISSALYRFYFSKRLESSSNKGTVHSLGFSDGISGGNHGPERRDIFKLFSLNRGDQAEIVVCEINKKDKIYEVTTAESCLPASTKESLGFISKTQGQHGARIPLYLCRRNDNGEPRPITTITESECRADGVNKIVLGYTSL